MNGSYAGDVGAVGSYTSGPLGSYAGDIGDTGRSTVGLNGSYSGDVGTVYTGDGGLFMIGL